MIILGITASSDKNAPSAPTIGTATNVGTGRAYNNGRADVTFTAPTYSGGSDIVSYTVTSSPGGFTGTGSASPISVTGLQSNTAYTFTVTATNAAGFTSPASAASNSITATTVPQAPTIGTATAGDASASVTFTAGATGGSAITTFTATSSPGSITGTAASSPITISGLTNGTAYTFTVTATNANGTSLASAASNSVTPAAVGAWESIASTTLNSTGVSSVTFSSIPQTYQTLIVRYIAIPATKAPLRLQMQNTTSGYNQSYIYGEGSFTPAANYNTGLTFGNILQVTQQETNQPTIAEIFISNYAGASGEKNMAWTAGCANTNSGTSGIEMGNTVNSNVTGAITSLTLTNNGPYNMRNGYIALYGIKGS